MISLLRQNGRPLTFVDRTNRYVVGFPSTYHAQYVQRMIDNSTPDIHLQRSIIHDVTDDVNIGLSNLSQSTRVQHITIDTDAVMSIQKYKKDMSGCFDIDQVGMADFMMYPFEQNLGIAMPYEITNDNDDYIVFLSQIVDPGMSMDIFRRRHIK